MKLPMTWKRDEYQLHGHLDYWFVYGHSSTPMRQFLPRLLTSIECSLEAQQTYVGLVSEHRVFFLDEVSPWDVRCGKLNLHVLGNGDVETANADSAAGIEGVVEGGGIVQRSLDEQRGILAI